MANFKKDFEEIDELLNDFSAPRNDNLKVLSEELKIIVVRSVLSAFAIPSQAYLDHLDSMHGNWGAEYDQMTKNMYHNHPQYNDFRDTINKHGAKDYLSERYESANQLHVDHITATKEIHEDPVFKLFLSPEERSEIANSKDNLGPLESAANQSKGDRPLEEWAKDTRKGQEANNIERFGLSEEKVKTIAQENAGFIKSKEFEVLKNELGSFAGEIAKTTFRLIAGYCLYKVGTIIVEEAQKVISAGFNSVSSFCKEMKRKTSEIISRIKEAINFKQLKEILKNSLKQSTLSAAISVVVGIISAIFNRIFNIRLVVMIIKQAITMMVRSGKVLWNNQKDKLKSIMKIALASLTAVAVVLISDAIIGFLPDFPFKVEIGNTLAGVFIGVLSMLLVMQFERAKKLFYDLTTDKAFANALDLEYKKFSEHYDEIYQKIVEDIYEYYDFLEKLIGDTFNPNKTFADQFTKSVALAKKLQVPNEKIIHNLDEGEDFFCK